eukprot:SAG31_NODE_16056_length_725_cov_0.846645_2_plen_94_part_00
MLPWPPSRTQPAVRRPWPGLGRYMVKEGIDARVPATVHFLFQLLSAAGIPVGISANNSAWLQHPDRRAPPSLVAALARVSGRSRTIKFRHAYA